MEKFKHFEEHLIIYKPLHSKIEGFIKGTLKFIDNQYINNGIAVSISEFTSLPISSGPFFPTIILSTP